MAEQAVIRAENVSKKFCKLLKQSMAYGVKDITMNMLGLSSHPERLRKDEFWAVDNVSFEVRRGETLGIIGANGSGKTTLLKMLSGIFWPDKGRIEVRGKVGALIAVGAGFHPDLSGRENVYLNGAILGMTRKEMARKFDTIIQFADIGDFLDTPVKYYSSGMFIRLGFAIAAYCDPDVLLVDEVLAVGDEQFRAKCYDRISVLKKQAGVIIVSHSLDVIGKACDTCLLVNKSKPIFMGAPDEAIDLYLSLQAGKKAIVKTQEIRLKNLEIHASKENDAYVLNSFDPVAMKVELESEVSQKEATILLYFHKTSGELVAEWNSDINGNGRGVDIVPGSQRLDILIKSLNLKYGVYYVSLVVTTKDRLKHLLWIHHGWKLRVKGDAVALGDYQLSGSCNRS